MCLMPTNTILGLAADVSCLSAHGEHTLENCNYFLRWLFPVECHQRAVTHKHSAYHSLHVQPLQTPLAGATGMVREKPHDPPAGSFPLSKKQGERRKKNKRKQARQTQKAMQGWFLRKISPTPAAVVSNRCTQPRCYSRLRGKIDSFSG